MKTRQIHPQRLANNEVSQQNRACTGRTKSWRKSTEPWWWRPFLLGNLLRFISAFSCCWSCCCRRPLYLHCDGLSQAWKIKARICSEWMRFATDCSFVQFFVKHLREYRLFLSISKFFLTRISWIRLIHARFNLSLFSHIFSIWKKENDGKENWKTVVKSIVPWIMKISWWN